MPITVACSKCAKQLTVRDEYAGKRLKCPGCGNVFEASAASAVAPLPGSVKKIPGANKGQPSFTVSPKVIIITSVVILVPTLILLWRIGPQATWEEWQKKEEIAKDDVSSVVVRALESHLASSGEYDPSKAHASPQTFEVTFLFGALHWSMPEKIGFVGGSTAGAFSGAYFPHTGEVQAEVEVDGLGLPSGVVVRRGNTKIDVTGRIKNGNTQVEIGGKPAVVHIPTREQD